MASVSKVNRGKRNGFLIRFQLHGKTQSFYLSSTGQKSDERKASEIAGMLDVLANCAKHSIMPDAGTRVWVGATKGNLRKSLVKWGFADPVDDRREKAEYKYVGAFVQCWIDGRKDLSQNTIENFNQLKGLLIDHFGENRQISTITQAEALKFQRWLTTDRKLAVATVSKHSKRCKQVFGSLVQDKILEENPFGILKGGDESNASRFHYVDSNVSKEVLEACPDQDWRTVFALARWGGLRCPSEVLTLKWTDIDWKANKIKIESPKTGLRFCPLFPELRKELDASWELAEDGAVFVVRNYRKGSNLRTQFIRILKSASIVPWEKPFQNLRSTRRTELQREYPGHVIDSWLGQSSEVAAKHYLQVTSDDWGRAVGLPIQLQECAAQGARTENCDSEKPNKNIDGSRKRHPQQDSNL